MATIPRLALAAFAAAAMLAAEPATAGGVRAQAPTGGTTDAAPAPRCTPGTPALPPCEELSPALVRALVLSGSPGVGVAVERLIPHVSRRDTKEGIQYVLDEWALVSMTTTSSPGVYRARLEGASSDELSGQLTELLREGVTLAQPKWGEAEVPVQVQPVVATPVVATPAPEADTRLLLVAAPEHRRYDRWSPLPAPRVRGEPLRTIEAAGVVVLRADFSADRALTDLSVLSSSRPLSSAELSELRERLALEYLSPDRRRAVAYFVLRLLEEREAVRPILERGVVLLPRECCPPECCNSPASAPCGDQGQPARE